MAQNTSQNTADPWISAHSRDQLLSLIGFAFWAQSYFNASDPEQVWDKPRHELAERGESSWIYQAHQWRESVGHHRRSRLLDGAPKRSIENEAGASAGGAGHRVRPYREKKIMTIVVVAKIDDGLVIACDSATSFSHEDGRVERVYNNTEKLLNLHQSLPIVLATWGRGSIENKSIATLCKEFGNKLFSDEKKFKTNRNLYTMAEIKQKCVDFFAEKLRNDPVNVGFFIAGYSAKSEVHEIYKMQIIDGNLIVGQVLKDASGMELGGQYGAVIRLIRGTPTIPDDVAKKAEIDAKRFEDDCRKLNPYLTARVIDPYMPLKDAADVVEFLVQTQIKYCRFTEGIPTVGGRIDMAVVTRHEGFRWIKRKKFQSIISAI